MRVYSPCHKALEGPSCSGLRAGPCGGPGAACTAWHTHLPSDPQVALYKPVPTRLLSRAWGRQPSGAAIPAAQPGSTACTSDFRGEHEGGCCGGPAPLPQPQRAFRRKLKPQARPVCGLHRCVRPDRDPPGAFGHCFQAGPQGALALSSTPPCSEPLLTLSDQPLRWEDPQLRQVKNCEVEQV